MPEYPATSLALNKGKYYVLLTIPLELREHFDGRKQLKRSTGTRDLQDAKRRQHKLSSELYAQLDASKPDIRDVISICLVGLVTQRKSKGWKTKASLRKRSSTIGGFDKGDILSHSLKVCLIEGRQTEQAMSQVSISGALGVISGGAWAWCAVEYDEVSPLPGGHGVNLGMLRGPRGVSGRKVHVIDHSDFSPKTSRGFREPTSSPSERHTATKSAGTMSDARKSILH